MNERIRELANIAAGRNIKTSPAVASDIADWAVIEKFAELIVQECADLFEVEYGQSEVSGNEVAEVLKQHFGVEE